MEKSVDRNTAQVAEGIAGFAEWLQSLALSLALPGFAVADRIEAGEWPTRERLDELLNEFPVESIVCELSVVAVTDLEYHIQYGLLDASSGRCSYRFAGSARYVDGPELCFESFVWPIDPGTQEAAEPLGDLICESTLSNFPVRLRVLFPARPEVSDETREGRERVQQRLRGLLAPASGNPESTR